MSKWLSNELIEDIGTEILHHRPASVFRPDSDQYVSAICAQAKEANRLRCNLNALIREYKDISEEYEKELQDSDPRMNSAEYVSYWISNKMVLSFIERLDSILK